MEKTPLLATLAGVRPSVDSTAVGEETVAGYPKLTIWQDRVLSLLSNSWVLAFMANQVLGGSFWGWKLAFVVVLLVHEAGHAVVDRADSLGTVNGWRELAGSLLQRPLSALLGWEVRPVYLPRDNQQLLNNPNQIKAIARGGFDLKLDSRNRRAFITDAVWHQPKSNIYVRLDGFSCFFTMWNWRRSRRRRRSVAIQRHGVWCGPGSRGSRIIGRCSGVLKPLRAPTTCANVLDFRPQFR